MKTLFAKTTTVLGIALGLLSLPASGQPLAAIVGTATVPDDVKRAQVLYEELHSVDASGLRHQVSYRSAGVEFASKSVDYSASLVAPNFMQRDTRRGEMLAARRDARGRVELGYRENSGFNERWRVPETSERPLVIDAGFDNFVRQHLPALIKGETLRFDFAVPSRGTAARLMIDSTATPDCGEPRVDGSHCFRVRTSSYLARLLFPPLHLLYGDDGQLLRFIGLSNISDADGDGQQVRIDYHRVVSP